MARKLPLLPTQFTWAEVPLWDGMSFFIDSNSKTTAENGSYELPAPNAFSLPHISTCPGSTEACRASCYVHGLEEHQPALYARYRENERTIHAILADGGNMARSESAYLLGAWIKSNCRGGFRWHVSGDVFSEAYASWIRRVCTWSEVRSWIYTRSLFAVPFLIGQDHLTVNISADRNNYARARVTAQRYGLRICYMSSAVDDVPPDLRPGDVIFPDYDLRSRPYKQCISCGDIRGQTDRVCRADGGHHWRDVVPNHEENLLWLSLSDEQRKMICPADMFGQSDNYRCGMSRCHKCLVKP